MTLTISLPGEHGELEFGTFPDGAQQGLLVMKRPLPDRPFVRIHSSCVFSEAFRTTDCDCARQLAAALAHIAKNGGVVVYLYQEGRGIGLAEKVRAISLQHERGCDTAAAFEILGHEPDPRRYEAAVGALKALGIKKVALATSSPRKITALTNAGFDVTREVLQIDTTDVIDAYLMQKRNALGHHG